MKLFGLSLIVGSLGAAAYAWVRRAQAERSGDEVPTAMGTFPPAEEIKTFKPQPKARNRKNVGPTLNA